MMDACTPFLIVLEFVCFIQILRSYPAHVDPLDLLLGRRRDFSSIHVSVTCAVSACTLSFNAACIIMVHTCCRRGEGTHGHGGHGGHGDGGREERPCGEPLLAGAHDMQCKTRGCNRPATFTCYRKGHGDALCPPCLSSRQQRLTGSGADGGLSCLLVRSLLTSNTPCMHRLTCVVVCWCSSIE